MTVRWRGLAAAVVLLAAGLAGQQAAAQLLAVQSSRHFLDGDDPSRTEFGALVLLSAIKMSSDNVDFGGISGLQISADGKRLLAVTDAGKWLQAALRYEEGGELTGLDAATLSPLRDEKGQPVRGGSNIDAESLSLQQPGDLQGPAYVSFERRHRIWFYPQGLGSKAEQMRTPPGLDKAEENKGLEAFERRADGSFIALAEHMLNSAGNHTGWLISGEKSQAISLRREGEFEPTDMEFLPDGDLLVLERRYTRLGGPGMQIRRVKADSIKPDAILDGEVLINLTARYGIDNFEGLSARRNDAGEIIIYVISDNNFSPLQKNLLLMFKLAQ